MGGEASAFPPPCSGLLNKVPGQKTRAHFFDFSGGWVPLSGQVPVLGLPLLHVLSYGVLRISHDIGIPTPACSLLV